MNDVLYFSAAALIVIISLSIVLKILIKKFDPEKSKVKLYGLLQGMSNMEIISASCSIINYIFLIYVMVSFLDLNWFICIISLLLPLLSGILIKNKLTLLNVLFNIISLGGIKIIFLIHDYITNEYMSVWMVLLLVFVMVFLFLYLTYLLLKNIKSIITSNKYIRKGDSNEN